jgi:hypothetical protein
MPHDNPFADFTDDKLLAELNVAELDWAMRWSKIREWRELRYGRDDVLSEIPESLRATSFSYHSPAFDEGVLNLSAFLAAATQTWKAEPPSDKARKKANELEGLLRTVFGANGVLDSEGGGQPVDLVWQNQVENGHGIEKLILKRNYPVRMPARRFTDDPDIDGLKADDYERNDDRRPKSRRARKSENYVRQRNLRETDAALNKRREEHFEDEFPWMRRSVNPETYWERTVDGVGLVGGEINRRPASMLEEHGLMHFNSKPDEGDYVYLGEPEARTGGQANYQVPVVDTFELWTPDGLGMFGFISQSKNNEGRKNLAMGKEQLSRWRHPYGRLPYYHSYGRPSTDPDRSYKYTGAFNAMISELPLLNHLETMHFNSVHRGYFPLYYPVQDRASGEQQPLDNMEHLTGVQMADTERVELPPGWRWEIMPSGFEPDIGQQLAAVRQRVQQSAIAAVLTGTSPGSADSGAKISLLINAAGRALSPFIRHREAPMQEEAQTMLRVSKMLGLDLHVPDAELSREDGTTFITPLTIKAKDIVTTAVTVTLNMALPVDQAAMEVRGITMRDTFNMSFQTVAERFFNIGDPEKELDRIRLERRDPQLDDVAFAKAMADFQQAAPLEFERFMGEIQPVEVPDATVGGGPQGAYNGAAAEAGRGGPASPTAIQMESPGI